MRGISSLTSVIPLANLSRFASTAVSGRTPPSNSNDCNDLATGRSVRRSHNLFEIVTPNPTAPDRGPAGHRCANLS